MKETSITNSTFFVVANIYLALSFVTEGLDRLVLSVSGLTFIILVTFFTYKDHQVIRAQIERDVVRDIKNQIQYKRDELRKKKGDKS